MKVTRKNIAAIMNDKRKEIGKFIEDHGGLVFHEIEFNRIVSQSFNTELSYFIAYNKNKIIGICPSHTIKRGFLRITYSNPAIFEVPFGGWVFDKAQVPINELLAKTRPTYNENLIYWSNIQTEVDDYKNIGIPKREFKTAIIDLTLPEDVIFSEIITSNNRSKIRRSIKKGVEIKIGKEENFEEFYMTFIEMKDKANLKNYPKEYYYNVIKHYCSIDRCRILISKFGDNLLSGLVIIGNKNFFHYWLGGMLSVNKNLYQNNYIHWEAIKWAKKNGCRYYDLCVIEKERLPHIAKFKLGFSKRLVPFYYISKRSITFKVLNRLGKWF